MNDRRAAAFVTGGGRGLGRAIAERLAAEGFAVGVLARTVGEIEGTAEAIRDAQGSAQAYACDVLDAKGLEKAVRRFREWAGHLDTLVCAAGRLQAVGPLDDVDPEAWWRDLETSVRGAQLAIRATLPLLRRSRSPSIQVLVGPGHNGELAHAAGYGAAQAALVRLVESLGRELAPDGIPIYAVYPGLVPTALVQRLLDRPEGRRWLPQVTEAFAEGKEVGPEVVADMVAWLATRRPPELDGRVVAAPQSPAILRTRMDRMAAENLGVLRLR
jgi:NAD(P)-dependent dehydrogenase (short-subunit alcohol dehydrogenase family)